MAGDGKAFLCTEILLATGYFVEKISLKMREKAGTNMWDILKARI